VAYNLVMLSGVALNIPISISRLSKAWQDLTCTTLGTMLAMTDGFDPFPFTSAALLPCTRRLILFDMAASVPVNYVGAHVDELSLGIKAHF